MKGRNRAAGRITAGLVALALGCSHGGAPDGDDYNPGKPSGKDMGNPIHFDLRPGPPDLMKPVMRSTVSFAPAVTYASDQLAFQIGSGNFNADGYPDLVAGGSTKMTVYMNHGDGTFDVKPVTTGTSAEWQLGADDLNGDGLGDLTWADAGGMRIGVAMGKGDGTFNPSTFYLSGKQSSSVIAADMNGDRHNDLVVATYSDDTLHVLLNDGTGVFHDNGGIPVDTMGTTANPIWVAQSDVNHDGKIDIMVSDYNTGDLNLFLGNGDGTLQMARHIAQMPQIMAVDFGDLNFDGNLDFAVIPAVGMDLAIYLGHGDGTFTAVAPVRLSATTGQGVRVADVNGDGILDVIGVCAFNSGARVFLGNGDGTFLAEKLFPGGGNNPFNVTVADFNHDGLNDLALSEGNDSKISVLLNTTVR